MRYVLQSVEGVGVLVLPSFAFLTYDAALCAMHCRVCGQLTERAAAYWPRLSFSVCLDRGLLLCAAILVERF